MNVLVVDDDPDFADGVAMTLQLNGHNVSVAANGEEGIRIFREKPFDVMLLDMRMPGLSGVDVLKQILNVDPTANVVMITAFGFEYQRAEALDSGAASVLDKPISGEALIRALRKACRDGVVMLVDDDPEFTEGIERTLTDAGFDVVVAGTGEDALATAKNREIDVLLLDLRLPGLSGLDVFRKLAELGRKPETIVVTGYGEEEADDLNAMLEMSARKCLRKPLNTTELLDEIEEALLVSGTKRAEPKRHELADAATKGRVLIIDDDSDFAEGLDLLLAPEHYEVEIIRNVGEVPLALQTFRPHIALIDIRLAGVNGIELLGRIRKQAPDVLCIVMTAFASTDNAIEALHEGAYSFLIKPFESAMLLHMLGRCMEHHRLQLEKLETEAQLQRALRMEAVGRLTGGIAHDFNNLLLIVSGNAELVLERTRDPKILECAESIITAADSGTQLTRRLLSFAQRQPFNSTGFDAAGALRRLKDLLSRSLGEEIRIEITAEGTPWPVASDAAQFEHAILNLAINARDAMPAGGRLSIRISNTVVNPELATVYQVRAGDYVLIEVTDNGYGMAPEVASRAFEPFFTTKGVDRGSGLGLSAVYGFAKQSGGHVTIDSEQGIGTTINLFLPSAGDEAADSAASQDDQGAEPESPRQTVLVVEDNREFSTLLEKMLTRLDYRVVAAPDATSAVAAFNTDKPIDVILTDIVLPDGINGFELIEQIRDQEPNVAVLFMSGFSTLPPHFEDLLQPGEAILTKPFTRAELADKMRAALGGA